MFVVRCNDSLRSPQFDQTRILIHAPITSILNPLIRRTPLFVGQISQLSRYLRDSWVQNVLIATVKRLGKGFRLGCSGGVRNEYSSKENVPY